MRKKFDTRKANPQKTDILRAGSLLQRSRVQSSSSKIDGRSRDLSDSTVNLSRESGFRQDFSSVPVGTASHLPLQPKLTVGQPGDRYEQEADRVAEHVMQSRSLVTVSEGVPPISEISRIQLESDEPLQRQPAAAEEEKKKIAKEAAQKAKQKKQQAEKEKVAAEEKTVKADKEMHDKEKKKKEDEMVQTQTKSGKPPTVTPVLENHLNTRQGSGQPLPESTRSSMESRFHRDFSKVRVHTAPQATQALNAQAFTRRGDIFFNPAQYQPETSAGQRLLAHELTHVVQQGAAPAKSSYNNG